MSSIQEERLSPPGKSVSLEFILLSYSCSAFTFRDRDKVKVCSQDECSLGFIIWMRELLIDARPVSHGSLCLCPAALISPTQSLTPALEGRLGCDVFRLR